MNETSGDFTPNVNAPNYSNQPRNMKLTPRGASNVPFSRVFPKILGGVCEFCGVLDPYQPGQYQYKFCQHYRGMDAKCIYCPLNKDQDEVVRSSKLLVAEHPYRPNELIMRCQSFECIKAHEQAFPATR